MALQGTLETFSVPEVLRLLSSTAKTGLLAIEGDRGSGRVWLGDGSIISAHSDHEGAGDVDATLFDLLRFASGDFVFDQGSTPEHPVTDEIDVEDALGRAEALLEEWRELETVVPSMLLGVRLARELDGDSVTITAQQWQSLAAVGSGASVAGLGQRLELGELDTCRRVRDLVESSLIQLTDEAPTPEPVADDPVVVEYDEPQIVDHDLSQDEVASLSSNLASFVAKPSETAVDSVDPVAADVGAGGQDHEDAEESAGDAPVNGTDLFDADVSDAADRTDAPEVAIDVVEGADAADAAEVESADDFLAQLTNLSPKAAAAIEATAEESATRSDADADVAAEPADDSDEEINRNLLLKFLSSTKN